MSEYTDQDEQDEQEDEREVHPLELQPNFDHMNQITRHRTYLFPNGYGVSILTWHRRTAPANREVTVTTNHGRDLTYATEVTDGVLTRLTEDEAMEIVRDVRALTEAGRWPADYRTGYEGPRYFQKDGFSPLD